MPTPTIVLTPKEKLTPRLLSGDVALVFIGKEKELPQIKECSGDYLNLDYKSGDPDEVSVEEVAELCSLKMIDLALDFAELCQDCLTIYVSDDESLSKAWMLALGLKVYFGADNRAAIFDLVKTHPDVDVSQNLWTVDLLDHLLKKQGQLVLAAEEYVATKVAVNAQGSVTTGRW